MSLGLAIAGGTAICLAPLIVTVFGRDPDANHHDLTDYHVPAPDNDTPLSLTLWEQLDIQDQADDILPPAPPGTNAGSPLYAAVTVHQQLLAQYGTTNHATIAAHWLRDLTAVNTVNTGATR